MTITLNGVIFWNTPEYFKNLDLWKSCDLRSFFLSSSEQLYLIIINSSSSRYAWRCETDNTVTAQISSRDVSHDTFL